jgi:two-component system, sensor histidine kinase and response regulator
MIKNIKILQLVLSIVLMMAIFIPSAQASQSLHLSSDTGAYSLGRYVDVYEDTSGKLSIDEIASGSFEDKFKPHKLDYLNVGATKSVYWMRFTVEMDNSNMDTQWHLDPGWYYYSIVEFYAPDTHSENKISSNDVVQYRQVKDEMRLFKLDKKNGNTYYLRLGSDYILYLNPVLRTTNNAVRMNCIQVASFVLLGSIILVMLVYNAVIFVVIRQSCYFYYVLTYSFGLIFGVANHWNPIFFYLFDHSISLVAINFSAAFWCLMTISIFDTQKCSPKYDKLLRIYAVFLFLWSMIGLYVPNHYFSIFTVLFCAGGWFICFSLSLYLSFLGVALARMIAVAWLVGYSFVLLYALNTLGFISIQTLFIPYMAYASESLLVSVVLAYRFKLIKEQYMFAEAVTKAKSTFLAAMSHEIRTPLTAVLGYANIMQKHTLPVEVGKYLRNIVIAANHLLDVISEILDMAKIESGKIELEHVEFDLHELLDKVMQICALKACVNRNELVLKVESGLPAKVLGDPVRLEQILINLISNAAKFTSDGEIYVHVHPVNRQGTHARAGAKTMLLGIDVRDTGIGIPEDKQNSLFEAFSQADSSTSRKFGGTGLGLVISRNLACLMGGDLTFVSQEQKGSTFTASVILGLVDKVPEELKLPPALPAHAKVLVIDDNAVAGEVLGYYARQLHLDPLIADSGVSALEILRQNPKISLVLVDTAMPDLDGVATVHKLFENGLSPEARIIMLEDADNPGDIPETSGRISHAITKPVTLRRLHKAICDIFASQQSEKNISISDGYHDLLKGKIVLVVDDNEFNIEVITSILSEVGINVISKNSGFAAIDTLRSDMTIEAVLMDVEMPQMDGCETTRRIRNDLKLIDLPIIALTANAFKEDYARCMESGMNDYLTKPVDTQLVYKKLFEWTRKTPPPKFVNEPVGY